MSKRVCRLCGIKLKRGYKFKTCDSCLQKERQRRRLLIQRRFEQSVCTSCGRGTQKPGHRFCASCLDRGKAYRDSCKADPQIVFRTRMVNLNRRDKYISEGRCVRCGLIMKDTTYLRCSKCRERRREEDRLRRKKNIRIGA